MEFDIKSSKLRSLIEKSLDDSKAVDITTIDLKGKTDIADFMVVASGTSSRHVNSIAAKLLEELRHNDIKGIEPEGTETGDWVLVDAIDIIVHIFKPEIRAKYEIEKMWQMPGEKKERKRRATKSN